MMTSAVSPLNSAGGGNILGFNIGSNQVLAVYGSLSGLVFEKISLPTSREGGFAQLSETLVQMADRLLSITQAQHLPTPDRVSICVSADIENTTGEIVASEDFPEWKHVPIRSQLASRFNLPVYLEESANAGALAEVYFGQGQSRRNVVFINLTPTVRAGIFSEGRIFRGQGGSAGKVGSFKQKMESAAHEGKDSSLNVLASASGMLRLALCRHSGHWPEDVALLERLVGEKLQEAKERLPQGYGEPALGPNSSGLGQVFWYTVESADQKLSAMDLRTLHDWSVRLMLRTARSSSSV